MTVGFSEDESKTKIPYVNISESLFKIPQKGSSYE